MNRQSERGYTLIEIMVSVVIMTIGATGILAMQGASVRSNQNAAETSVAINFATTWLERVKRDARLWTAIGTPSNTVYLSQVTGNEGNWFAPSATAPESAGANYFGFDEPLTGDVRYCVNLKLTRAHVFGGNIDAIRADVMVWWKRTNAGDATVSSATCTANAGLTPAQLSDVTLRKHFLSSIVTWRDPTVWP